MDTTVPTNPRNLATHPDFPDLSLYRDLLNQIGKAEADRVWADAEQARDGGVTQ